MVNYYKYIIIIFSLNIFIYWDSLPYSDNGRSFSVSQYLDLVEKNLLIKKNNNQKENETDTDWQISGDYSLRLGINSRGDIFWKRSLYDLNEENWRIFSNSGLNNQENTFDPGIFSQLRVNVDGKISPFNLHFALDISPWSFLGKSNKQTVTNNWNNDYIELELKFWQASGYTLPEIIYTNNLGAAVSTPELKVSDQKVSSFSVQGSWADTYQVPETEIEEYFWPWREFWVNYQNPNSPFSFVFFPLATEKIAYSSYDPLGLVNHHTYWEESPWLLPWQGGHFNSGAGDFFPGFWDDSLVYSVRDASGLRLTSLRGISSSYQSEGLKFNAMVASPKLLWDDYDEFSTFAGAGEVQWFWNRESYIGFLYSGKSGYSQNKLQAQSNTWSLYGNYFLSGYKNLFLQVAFSQADYDRKSDYHNQKEGMAYYFKYTYNSLGEKINILENKKTLPVYQYYLTVCHMDDDFESALASYHFTRNDSYWSRHITFRKPFNYYYQGLYGPSLSWDEIKNYRLGDGIDYGRDVIVFNLQGNNYFQGKFDFLVNFRNVHNVNGKYIETVNRIEAEYRPNLKLTLKSLGIYHHLPKTKYHQDPFIIDPLTQQPYENTAINDGEDPSLKTFSLGGEYKINNQCSINAVWEHTNDIAYAYDNFPRGLYSWSSFTTYEEEGKIYRRQIYGLNYANVFAAAPYPYYNIFKFGLRYRLNRKSELYLSYTRNEYEWVQLIDENMNHIGLEFSWNIFSHLSLYLRYVYSRGYALSYLNETGLVRKDSHHNLFGQVLFKIKDNKELFIDYGAGMPAVVASSSYSPFGGGIATLDTIHLLRLVYRQKF